MQRHTLIKSAAVCAVATAGLLGVASYVANAGGNGADTPITGDDLRRASDAALAHTGQGRVSETEVGDEDSYYEVEVTLDDGSQVDIQLNRTFHVVGAMPDSETGTDDADADQSDSDGR